MRSSSYNIVAFSFSFAFAFAFAVSRPASSFVAPERAPRSGGIIVGIRALDASPPRDDVISGGDDDHHHRRDHDDDGLGGGGFFGIGGWGWGGVAEMEEEPLDRIFRRGVALQRAGDGAGCLREYERFLKAAEHHGADPSLYAEVHANVGAMHAAEAVRKNTGPTAVGRRAELRRKARDSLSEAVRYRPGLGSAWVNLALLTLSEGRETATTTTTASASASAGRNGDDDDAGGGGDDEGRPPRGGAGGGGAAERCLKEARQCCERALGMDNDDERSRALANKLIADIDAMMKQQQQHQLREG